MADRIVVMNAGGIEQVGTPEDLYARPQTRFVAGFIGSPPMNIVDVEQAGEVVQRGEAALPLSGANGSAAAAIGIRPEHVHFGNGGLPGTVAGIEPLGRETLSLVDTPAGALRVLEAGPASVRAGETVHLSWDATASLAFDAEGKRIPGAHVSTPV
jgi:inositol-phosphate transport system ATP-binding protein